jgi:hypothetical protein
LPAVLATARFSFFASRFGDRPMALTLDKAVGSARYGMGFAPLF